MISDAEMVNESMYWTFRVETVFNGTFLVFVTKPLATLLDKLPFFWIADNL
jgi:hypothetical protein